MWKKTQKEFDDIKPSGLQHRDRFPQGDYSRVTITGGRLIFPDNCIFAPNTVFVYGCKFAAEMLEIIRAAKAEDKRLGGPEKGSLISTLPVRLSFTGTG